MQREKLLKPKLFNYPDWDSPVAVFDFEDLENTESMLVLCVRQAEDLEFREQHVCYVWKGPDFDVRDHEQSATFSESQFVQKCISEYWGAADLNKLNIKVVEEQPDSPSEAFQYFFD